VDRPTVVLVHNRYQHAGGEDDVFEAEGRLLESHGHRVERVTVDNRDLSTQNPLAMAVSTVWNRTSYRHLRDRCRESRADVVHFHNTFPIISPAGYYAAHAEGAAVVQTLHNFRLVCLNALCFRDGRACEDCVTKSLPWPGVAHKCYRNSRSASGVTAAMLSLHGMAGTWTSHVDTYIALSEFARSRFLAGGIPATRLVVKPNFLNDDPGAGAHTGHYALYVGRLSPEKGIALLTRAWSVVGSRLPLKVVGSGPLEGLVSSTGRGIEWLGPQPRARVMELMRDAALLVFPSEVYENCPMTLIEAFAAGLPVVASGHGSIGEIVRDGVTGLHFRPGDVNQLTDAVMTLADDPVRRAGLGVAARCTFERTYTAEHNYEQLSRIYESALQRRRVAA
jgi:glycosyltransferase involved in cell wall biosynthesis